MKNKKIIPIILFLLIILAYTTNITAIPNNIILFKDEELKLGNIAGVTVNIKDNPNYSAVLTSNSDKTISTSKNITAELSLFNTIPLKNINVSVIPSTTVIPVGNTIGLKLYTDGVMVIGMSEIEGKRPYEKTGIKEGDMIVSINDVTIECTADLIREVNQSKGNNLKISYIREGEKYSTEITPAKTTANQYKLGLWVRDAAAGVGTMTFYEPSSGNFAALGHGIIDIDTDKLITISNGEVVNANILSIVKGKKGTPRRNKRNSCYKWYSRSGL